MGGDRWKKVIAVFVGAFVAYWFLDDFDPESLKGKRVLVTGASTGIGEQLAYQYARLGASVVVTARRQDALRQVVKRCRELGSPRGVYGFVPADMANLSATHFVIQDAVRQMGGLDVLVLNHILPHHLAPWTGSSDNLTLLHRLVDVNFVSYVHLASAAMPHLRQSATPGSIIVMSSVTGKLGMPFVAAYSATKFALNGFFGALRNELIMAGEATVSITLCTIGFVGTENAIHYLTTFGNKNVLGNLRPADPADVALEVLKAGATGQHEVFYPYLSTKPLIVLRDWLPETVDRVVRYFNIRTQDS